MFRIAILFTLFFLVVAWLSTWIVQIAAVLIICAVVAVVFLIAIPVALISRATGAELGRVTPAQQRLANYRMIREAAAGAKPKAKHKPHRRHGRHHQMHMLRHALRGHSGGHAGGHGR